MGIVRHCPIHFYCCPLPAAHDTINYQNMFCACVLDAISALQQAITIQTDLFLTGHQLVTSKASIVSNKVAPTQSSSTKFTKTPSSGPQCKSSSKLHNHHHNRTRQSLPNSHHDHHPHSTNHPTRVLVKSPSRLEPLRTARNHTVHRYEHCFLELSRPQTKTEGTTKLFARKSN